MKECSKTLANFATESKQSDQSNIQYHTCTTEPTLPCLIDKFADVVIENNGVALIISTAIAASIILCAGSKSVAIITAWRSNINS